MGVLKCLSVEAFFLLLLDLLLLTSNMAKMIFKLLTRETKGPHKAAHQILAEIAIHFNHDRTGEISPRQE
jgi:hypothetical protein